MPRVGGCWAAAPDTKPSSEHTERTIEVLSRIVVISDEMKASGARLRASGDQDGVRTGSDPLDGIDGVRTGSDPVLNPEARSPPLSRSLLPGLCFAVLGPRGGETIG